jgi:hypothetical protein
MATDTILLPGRAILTLDEPITHQSCMRLGRELEVVVEYHGYTDVEIRIASPGWEWADLIGLLNERTHTTRTHTTRGPKTGKCKNPTAKLLSGFAVHSRDGRI